VDYHRFTTQATTALSLGVVTDLLCAEHPFELVARRR
jgi:hypothetical protein